MLCCCLLMMMMDDEEEAAAWCVFLVFAFAPPTFCHPWSSWMLVLEEEEDDDDGNSWVDIARASAASLSIWAMILADDADDDVDDDDRDDDCDDDNDADADVVDESRDICMARARSLSSSSCAVRSREVVLARAGATKLNDDDDVVDVDDDVDDDVVDIEMTSETTLEAPTSSVNVKNADDDDAASAASTVVLILDIIPSAAALVSLLLSSSSSCFFFSSVESLGLSSFLASW